MLRQEIRVDVVTGATPIELETGIVNALEELKANQDWEFEVQSIQYSARTIDDPNEWYCEYSALIFYKMWPVVQVQQG